MNAASVQNIRKPSTHIVTFNLTFICLQITTKFRKSRNYSLKQAETVMDKLNLSLQIWYEFKSTLFIVRCWQRWDRPRFQLN